MPKAGKSVEIHRLYRAEEDNK